MSELVFLVEDAPEGGFTARSLGESIFTEAEDWEGLKRNILEAVGCHFEGRSGAPAVVRLHWVRDEVLAV
jgi:hypothetical protein